ncbi:MAG: NAD-dependent epimerase/dehydratase family protein [Deltaproteobacteria bacterium]|nr:NAD-dependent epimerase/dehydratase family protein [Deltaproteobacteria bacterium]
MATEQRSENITGTAGATWLITGGCGFIGTSLISRLLKEDPDVKIRVLDNLSASTRDDLAEVCSFREAAADAAGAPDSGVELLVGDIRSPDDCRSACRGIQIIVHLAAQVSVPNSVADPVHDMDLNVRGVLTMLEAARNAGAQKFIFASSAAPLGEVPQPVHEERAPRPASPYGASKLAGEGYCSAYFKTFGLKTIALRFGNVYGPRTKRKTSVVAKFFKQALDGQTLEIYGDGSQTRDFIYIADLIRAITLAAAKDIGGEIFQIATNRETTVNEIAVMIKYLVEAGTGKQVPLVHGGERLGDIKRNFSDISKAKRMLGYNPEFDVERGLKETLEYFRRIGREGV